MRIDIYIGRRLKSLGLYLLKLILSDATYLRFDMNLSVNTVIDLEPTL